MGFVSTCVGNILLALIVYLWFVQKRSESMPVSGPLLCEKANLFHQLLHSDDEEPSFTASSGWLWRFCARHGIRQLSLQGEKLSADAEAPEPFREKLKEVIELEGFTLNQVYNCDETGLYFRLLPKKTLACASEKGAPGMKSSKDRVTLMACANTTGTHKLPLLFVGKNVYTYSNLSFAVGKAANPRCFKHINKTALPVKYYNQKNAWVDANIFRNWFFVHFVPAVELYQRQRGLEPKALLLLDNASAHPNESILTNQVGTIKAMFLPPNTTSLIQPMDQGVLESLKRRYKKKLLRSLVMADEEGTSMFTFLKSVNIKDVVYRSAQAWDDVPSSTLVKSWCKLLQGNDRQHEEIEEIEDEVSPAKFHPLFKRLKSDISNEEVMDWLQGTDDPGHQVLTDEDIVQLVSVVLFVKYIVKYIF